MWWTNAINSSETDWANRPTESYVFWNDANHNGAVPIEVEVALCNEIGADGWFNMPVLSTDDYVTQFATLVHSMLNSNLKAYVEYGNEIWNNGAFPSTLWTDLVAAGKAAFPSYDSTFGAAFYYGILRAVQDGATWKSVWGADAGRVVRILAGQDSYTARNQFILNFTAGMYGGDPTKFTGTAAQNADAFATAPYFGYPVPDTFTLDQLFTEMNSGGLVSGGYPGGMIKQTLDQAASDYSVAQAAGLPLVAYEGGQTFVDYSHSDTALQNLYAAANRDPRMGTAYTTFFNGWKNLGGTLFINFTDVSAYNQWGYWGVLENVMETSSSRYDALLNFISNNPCWWNNCSTPASSGLTTSGTTTSGSTSSGSTTSGSTTSGSTTSGSTTSGSTTSSSGNSTPSVSLTPPTVALTSPHNGAVYKSNGAINITASASDASGIASISIAGDNTSLVTCTEATSCSATWQGKKIARGTHTISATAVNNKGLPANTSITIVDLK